MVDAYCQQVLKPLFTAEADYGLVLLAHQQNILVQMLGDLPVGFIYRDCQGSAFMPHATDWLDSIGEAQAENISPMSSCCAISLITCWLTPLLL